MNRFPLWLNILISVVLLVSLIYAVPNLFGESPAVQISSARTTLKMNEGVLAKAKETLGQANIALDEAFLDLDSVKVSFHDTDTQLKAKDILEKVLGGDYVVAFNQISNSPRWMSKINAKPMYLGLDLRGGVHFLLQVDMKGAITKSLDNTASQLRVALRGEDTRYAGISREGAAESASVVIRFREAAKRANAVNVIKKDYPNLVLRTEDRGEDFLLSGTLTPEAIKGIREFAVQQNLTTLRNRVNELGVAEPIVQQAGQDRIVVQLPGVQDTAKAKDILGRTASLEVRMVDTEAVPGEPKPGTEVFPEMNRDGTLGQVSVKRQVVLTGDRITDARPTQDQNGDAAVSVSLDGVGGRVMLQTTRENLNKPMAIIMFEKGKGEAISVATIRGEFSTQFQITGRFTTEETTRLSLLLRAGALAAPMDFVEERTVGPSLGKENIRLGFQSMWMGFAVLSVCIMVYYSLFGVVSVIALAANLLMLVALLSMLQATLTLPGIAAIALTLGMAIDANVLINERIREELRNGTTPQAAIATGYERAWATILDSNLTSLFAGIALFLLGSGPVRGFAVVHCLGILTSMFSAVLVSRSMVNFIFGSRKKLERVPIGNVDWHRKATV
ncbi:MAG: protein translocase subunit SecD [Betaproteobacteria bacterium]|nr:protein translocase subunit SecD [Betaproteobacteria bacterium]